MQLEEKVLYTIKQYELIKDGDTIVVGVSGGPDSMTLLNVLYDLKDILHMKVVVAHINHMLRKEADQETAYVEDYCKQHRIEVYVKRVDVAKIAKEKKKSTELVGRDARYCFFEEVSQKVGAIKIATAHTANDNAETVLMNLIRGSGTSGLKGIEKIRDGKFIRPIIACTRKEIEEYCKEKELHPKYDKTNGENIYTRNKIRNILIPCIEQEFNPNIIETLNRLSDIVVKEEEFFHQIVEKDFENLRITVDKIDLKENPFSEKGENVIILNLKKFNLLEDVIKSRLILYTINRLLGNAQGIQKIHIDDILELCKKNIGNKYLSPQKNIKIYVKKGKIFFIGKT